MSILTIALLGACGSSGDDSGSLVGDDEETKALSDPGLSERRDGMELRAEGTAACHTLTQLGTNHSTQVRKINVRGSSTNERLPVVAIRTSGHNASHIQVLDGGDATLHVAPGEEVWFGCRGTKDGGDDCCEWSAWRVDQGRTVTPDER